MITIINPSFEDNFNGWEVFTPVGAETVVTSSFLTYLPVNGNYFALLKNDGPGNFTSVSQSFSAQAGDIIAGWAFFKTYDYMPYDDYGEVIIRQGATTIATVFLASISTVGDYGQTPWTYWQYLFTSPGVYTIEARITNVGDDGFDSYLGLDALGDPVARGIRIDEIETSL
jgi:hypothetical protein